MLTLSGRRNFLLLNFAVMVCLAVLLALAGCNDSSGVPGTNEISSVPVPTKQPVITPTLSLSVTVTPRNPILNTIHPTSELTGKRWNLRSYNNGSGKEPTPVETYIEFKVDGKFYGGLDCNSIFGDYTTRDNNTISFGPMFSTAAACGKDGRLNQSFNLNLDDATSFEIAGDTLSLKNKDGVIILVFTKG